MTNLVWSYRRIALYRHRNSPLVWARLRRIYAHPVTRAARQQRGNAMRFHRRQMLQFAVSAAALPIASVSRLQRTIQVVQCG